MTQSDSLKNAYTDALALHSNLLLGSLQLMFWLFVRPSTWRNYLKRMVLDLSYVSITAGILNRESKKIFLVLEFIPIGKLIDAMIRLVMFVAAILVFLYLVLGFIEWITSGGNSERTKAARNKITAAVIGSIILAATYAIMQIALSFLGIRPQADSLNYIVLIFSLIIVLIFAIIVMIFFIRESEISNTAPASKIEVAIQNLKNCHDIAAIRDIHRGFYDEALYSLQLEPEKFGSSISILRTFNRISHDVDVALCQETNYNQRLALSPIEDHLDRLSRELMRSRIEEWYILLRKLTRSHDIYIASFHPIAEQWRKVIVAYIKNLTRDAEQLHEIDNPYVALVPLTMQQEIFVGRTDIGTRIEHLLLGRRHLSLLLYGQRRMGKTSLLNNLGRLLPSTIVPLFVDLQGPASRASDHAGLLYNIARSMTNSARQQRDMLLPALSRDALQADPFTAFEVWMGDVDRDLGSNTALLALDEFEVLDGAISRGRFDEDAVLGMLRHLIQHRPRFKVLIAGSHTLEEFQRWASYLINVQVVRVGYLKPDETRQLIEHPVEGFALRYEPDAVARAMALTRGHPALTQLLCSEIVALKNEQPPTHRRLATLADVEAAVPEALDHGSFFFADIEYNQVDAAGLALLRLIAAQGEGAAVPEAALRQACPDAAARAEALALLLRRDLLESVDGGYRFQVELIRRWFTR